MAFQISNLVASLGESVTLKYSAAANKKKAEISAYLKDKDPALVDMMRVIVLAAGEPDFNTPDNVKAAAITAIKADKTRYTPVEGVPELRTAIRDDIQREYNLSFDPNSQILVGVGAKNVIETAVRCLVNPGDKVIIPTPYWTSYPEMVRLSGGIPIFVEGKAEAGFKMTAAQLEETLAANPNTKLVMLNSPSNPTGAVYSEQELRAIADVLLKYPGVGLMSDDIYKPIVYDGLRVPSILEIEPSLADRTLIVNGLSKKAAMTGWRVGYAAGPANLIKAMKVVQSQSATHTTSFAQWGAIEALQNSSDYLQMSNAEFEKRRDFVYDAFGKIPGLSVPMKPQGAFYLYIDCAGVIGKYYGDRQIKNDGDYADMLLEQANLGVVPGVGFGWSPAIRISYAASMKDLELAAKRITAFNNNLTETPRPANAKLPPVVPSAGNGTN